MKSEEVLRNGKNLRLSLSVIFRHLFPCSEVGVMVLPHARYELLFSASASWLLDDMHRGNKSCRSYIVVFL